MSAVAKFHRRYRAETADLGLFDWDGFIADDAPDWAQALRKRGHENVIANGLPTPKLERFKYFNLPAWLKKNELSYKPADIAIDGNTDYVTQFGPRCSYIPDWTQEAAESAPIGEDKYGDMMLWRLSDAYFKDGIVVDVPANTKSDAPLNLTITGHDGAVTMPRLIIRVAKGSDFTLCEYHIGQGAAWNNAVTQVIIEEGARFRHYRMQENPHEAAYTQNTHVKVADGAQYEAFTLTNGAAQSRHQLHVELQGPEASCDLNGINILSGKQNADTTITVEHQAPQCRSNQNYRNVVTDQATGIFQGKVHVHQIAQQTDGYQLSNSLLLSPQAVMNTKPELEIYADDVKCSHGATSGRLDEKALFYLRSRGIPELQARALLIQAFVSEVMEDISFDPIKEQGEHIVQRWLDHATLSVHTDWVEE
ncbi:MAG: Fe-S cluster assembly protein SufD [Pseudomonadota bacterium]